MNMKVLFILQLILSTFIMSNEVLNPETICLQRTKQYRLKDHDQVVVISAPRTGSMITYNVFRFLFESTAQLSRAHNVLLSDSIVVRTHLFSDLDLLKKKQNILYIIPIRNPVDATISRYRIRLNKKTNLNSFVKGAIDQQCNYLNFYEERIRNGDNALLVRFEEFNNNLEGFLDFIEDHLFITIDPNDRELIITCFKKSNINKYISQFPDFSESLSISGFHGSHIQKDSYSPPNKIYSVINAYLRKVKPLFRKYGYFPSSP
ncbi:MAG: hypothetical protein S4CHLAM37_04370 [Chlamydiia bacterium]|nr:hypothetical protein [Chlamydiia bacterium]